MMVLVAEVTVGKQSGGRGGSAGGADAYFRVTFLGTDRELVQC